MPFNPNEPQAGELIDAVQLRGQFNALNDLIQTTLPGPPGPEGPQGPPGEVTTAQMTSAIDNMAATVTSNSSANTNGVGVLEITIADPPTQSDVQAVVNKLNDLIIALRR